MLICLLQLGFLGAWLYVNLIRRNPPPPQKKRKAKKKKTTAGCGQQDELPHNFLPDSQTLLRLSSQADGNETQIAALRLRQGFISGF